MAHEWDSGFVVREPAWHGLAPVLDEYPDNWTDARRLAGLDWEPVEETLYMRAKPTGGVDLGIDDNPMIEVPGHKVIRRSDTGRVLATHRDSYEVFPNADLGPLIEAMLDQDGVEYETAGSLRGGAKVWALVKMREPFEIPGDPRGATLSRLAVQNSHDGSGSLRVQRLQTRIVCDNTSQAADREAGKHGMEYRFRHTKRIAEYVEDAKIALAGLRSDQERYVEWAHDLMGLRISPEQREMFVQTFIPQPVGDVVSERVRRNVENAQDRLRAILVSPTTEAVNHTAYGLVGAAIEYLDHGRAYRTKETHFTRSYLQPEALKTKAEKIAREVALA